MINFVFLQSKRNPEWVEAWVVAATVIEKAVTIGVAIMMTAMTIKIGVGVEDEAMVDFIRSVMMVGDTKAGAGVGAEVETGAAASMEEDVVSYYTAILAAIVLLLINL